MIRIHPNLLTAIVLMTLVYLALPRSVIKEPVLRQPASVTAAPSAPRPAITPPPDLRQLLATATQAEVGQNPTQQAIEQEQIREALTLVRSADPSERRIGIEQLSAYPSAAGEKALLTALQDRDAGVRQAAWNALSQLPSPSDSLVNALIDRGRKGPAMQKTAAVETLSAYLDSATLAPVSRERILKGFHRLLKDKTLSEALRESLREALE